MSDAAQPDSIWAAVSPFSKRASAASFGFEFASHIWPDCVADHDFARTGGSDEPRAQIHSLA